MLQIRYNSFRGFTIHNALLKLKEYDFNIPALTIFTIHNALLKQITAMKNIISQKLDAVANAIKNRNLVLNVHGLTPDEVIARIKAAIEKG